jgi:hypothetical protein
MFVSRRLVAWKIRRRLFEMLADLFGSKCANAVETETKHNAILFSETYVEGRELSGHRTTVPGIPR